MRESLIGVFVFDCVLRAHQLWSPAFGPCHRHENQNDDKGGVYEDFTTLQHTVFERKRPAARQEEAYGKSGNQPSEMRHVVNVGFQAKEKVETCELDYIAKQAALAFLRQVELAVIQNGNQDSRETKDGPRSAGADPHGIPTETQNRSAHGCDQVDGERGETDGQLFCQTPENPQAPHIHGEMKNPEVKKCGCDNAPVLAAQSLWTKISSPWQQISAGRIDCRYSTSHHDDPNSHAHRNETVGGVEDPRERKRHGFEFIFVATFGFGLRCGRPALFAKL